MDKLERIDLFYLRLPLRFSFETSFGRSLHTDTIIVKVVSGGIAGYGEIPASDAPLYTYETVTTAGYVLKNFLVPRLAETGFPKPEELPAIFSFVRGHNMAKAGIESAIWDLQAKMQGIPLYKLLGGVRDEIPSGISLGIEENIEKLSTCIQSAIEKGYKRVKLKIKRGWDEKVLREVRKGFPSVKLMVDANGAYKLDDTEHLKKLDNFNLMMVEQPLDWDDYVDHAVLAKNLSTPICLDESIKSPEDGRKAIELGSCKVINIKQARVGGLTNAKKLHNISKDKGIPVWCGGLLESGVGRAHNVALATLTGFILPGDISASERYYEEDIIEPPVSVLDGFIKLQNRPGIGYDVIEMRFKKYLLKSERLL